jgi:sugar/nucleoside kinase (ribokinase family)
MALTEYDILIPGNYFCDLIFTGFPQFPALGTEVYTQELTVTVGGVLNTVIAMRRLGVNVGWLGQIGSDFFSRFVLETVEKEGVDTSLLRRVDDPYQRVTVSVSYPQDRAFITYVDPATTSVEMTLEALDNLKFRHLHFTGLQLDPRTPELLKMAKARGATLSMDCQHRPVTLESPLVREILSQLTLFMPNVSEALRLTECDALPQAVNALREFVPDLIVKDGANGAFAWVNDQYHHVPAIQVECIDTTGAGDVFNAGFLTAYLEGRTVEDCLRWGNICGGLSTLGRGGTSTAPTREEVEHLFE